MKQTESGTLRMTMLSLLQTQLMKLDMSKFYYFINGCDAGTFLQCNTIKRKQPICHQMTAQRSFQISQIVQLI